VLHQMGLEYVSHENVPQARLAVHPFFLGPTAVVEHRVKPCDIEMNIREATADFPQRITALDVLNDFRHRFILSGIHVKFIGIYG